MHEITTDALEQLRQKHGTSFMLHVAAIQVVRNAVQASPQCADTWPAFIGLVSAATALYGYDGKEVARVLDVLDNVVQGEHAENLLDKGNEHAKGSGAKVSRFQLWASRSWARIKMRRPSRP